MEELVTDRNPAEKELRSTVASAILWTPSSLPKRASNRMALKHVYYHVRIESPVCVRCRIQHAWGWCTGMTQRDVMGREVGGGFMFGNACTPVVDSCQCMAKPIQYCKAK